MEAHVEHLRSALSSLNERIAEKVEEESHEFVNLTVKVDALVTQLNEMQSVEEELKAHVASERDRNEEIFLRLKARKDEIDLLQRRRDALRLMASVRASLQEVPPTLCILVAR